MLGGAGWWSQTQDSVERKMECNYILKALKVLCLWTCDVKSLSLWSLVPRPSVVYVNKPQTSEAKAQSWVAAGFRRGIWRSEWDLKTWPKAQESVDVLEDVTVAVDEKQAEKRFLTIIHDRRLKDAYVLWFEINLEYDSFTWVCASSRLLVLKVAHCNILHWNQSN